MPVPDCAAPSPTDLAGRHHTTRLIRNDFIVILRGGNMGIPLVKKGIGRYQKGEDKIVSTYPNADAAVDALLNRLD